MGAQPQHEEFPKSQFPKFLLSFSLLALKSWQLSVLRSPLRAAKIWDVISLKLSLLPTPFCSHLFSKGFSKGAAAPPWNQRIFGIFGIFGIREFQRGSGWKGHLPLCQDFPWTLPGIWNSSSNTGSREECPGLGCCFSLFPSGNPCLNPFHSLCSRNGSTGDEMQGKKSQIQQGVEFWSQNLLGWQCQQQELLPAGLGNSKPG